MNEFRKYADGTYLQVGTPWSIYVGGKALCTDGKVRKLKRIALSADTFFSVPAAVSVKGKTVSGFVMVQSRDGYDTATPDDPGVVKFFAYKYGKNGHLLEEGSAS